MESQDISDFFRQIDELVKKTEKKVEKKKKEVKEKNISDAYDRAMRGI